MNERLDQRSRREIVVAEWPRLVKRLGEDRLGAQDVAVGERSAEIEQQSGRRLPTGLEQFGRAGEQPRPRARHRGSPRGARHRQVPPARGQIHGAVRGLELDPIAERLLEVIADELVVVGPRDQPLREPLVQLRRLAFGELRYATSRIRMWWKLSCSCPTG